MATKADDALEPGMAKVGKSADDMVEDGALLTARELLGDPNAARLALTKRIGKLSEEDAVKRSARLLKAEAEGRHAADPHYRSLFNRPEEKTSELQSLIRTSYAVFCLTKN